VSYNVSRKNLPRKKTARLPNLTICDIMTYRRFFIKKLDEIIKLKSNEIIKINEHSISSIKIDHQVSEKITIGTEALVRYITNRYSGKPRELEVIHSDPKEIYYSDSFTVTEGHVRLIFKVIIKNLMIEILDVEIVLT
jgi:hypothetical protein